MADILSAHGLELPVLDDDLQRRILALLPSLFTGQPFAGSTIQMSLLRGHLPEKHHVVRHGSKKTNALED
jgi:hypothetical protein